ncbi:MAG: TIGR00645 family protein [Methylobacteriaceae bacterium]|nr:TIGR00645 family protein [Methylobacteriaceae bacterium]
MAASTERRQARVERAVETFIFGSRWLLAPFYCGLVVALVVLLGKAAQELFHFVTHAFSASEAEVILGVLTLVDLTFTGSLLVIVIFSGYENFVSKIDVEAHEDWPEWMAKIDFTGLKLKLMSSIVAISAIQLLKIFMDLKNTGDREIAWYVGLHLVFVISGLIFALTDRVGEGAKGHDPRPHP